MPSVVPKGLKYVICAVIFKSFSRLCICCDQAIKTDLLHLMYNFEKGFDAICGQRRVYDAQRVKKALMQFAGNAGSDQPAL